MLGPENSLDQLVEIRHLRDLLEKSQALLDQKQKHIESQDDLINTLCARIEVLNETRDKLLDRLKASAT